MIVTGASRGIGAAAAAALAKEGASVRLTAAMPPWPPRSRPDHRGRRPRLRHPCDVSDYAAVEWLVTETEGRFGRVDALINNAA